MIVQDPKHFKYSDFRCSHCQRLKIDSDLVELVNRARDQFGGPIIVTSGYRCPTYNRSVGGVRLSKHVQGLAADITPIRRGARPFLRLFDVLMELNPPGLGYYWSSVRRERFFHVDLRPKGRGRWGYAGDRKFQDWPAVLDHVELLRTMPNA